MLARLLGEGPAVIATGGGAWMQPRVRELVKTQATSIWLRAELEVLVDRVSRRDHRPLLRDGNKQEIMQRLMQERYPVYSEADLTVDSSNGPHDRVVERTLAALKEYPR